MRKKRILLISIFVTILALTCVAIIVNNNNTLLVQSTEQNSQPSTGNTNNTATTDVYYQRFMEIFNDIQTKGYLSEEGVPYHSIETLMVEAPDYGHLSTSEAFSYYTWLGAVYGKMTGDWSYYKKAWDVTEKYIIPNPQNDQPGVNTYPQNTPAQYAPEAEDPSMYPVNGDGGAPTGFDPIGDELAKAYGDKSIYQMHWLLDVDNWYGYGNHGDGVSRCSYINTYQRGSQESVWETIPHPSWEDFRWGQASQGGFLPLFGNFGQPAKQWRYSSASDADGRQVQASYWALQWAKEQGKEQELSQYNNKASKMGDYLRYTMFDKYFRPIGVQDTSQKGNGYDSCHYLMSWYMSWGGDLNGAWSWRIGSSHCHQGYQNPMAAYALSSVPDFKPDSAHGQEDWAKSLDRQIELFQYLQSSEGAIAGGVTNSVNGKYDAYSSDTSTFYDLAFDWQPVYHDPPSNKWFGFQVWSMERFAEYYYITGDERAKSLCNKWVKWAISQIKFNKDGTYEIPSSLEWKGSPDSWNGTPTDNSNLTCKVTEWGTDIGVSAGLAKTLIYYAAATEKHEGKLDENSKQTAKEILDRMWNLYRTDKGIAAPEEREDYKRFFDEVYIPENFNGINAQGAQIVNGATFLDLRPAYKNDPDFAKIQTAYEKNEVPVMTYHRFWAQADVAMANALYYIYLSPQSETISVEPPLKQTKENSLYTSNQPLNQRSASGSFNYGEALQKSILFYEFQRSGDLDPTKLRNNWRGDSGLKDGADVGLDLTGGWYDAGDHVKFGLPMAYTSSMLSWSIYEYKEAFEETGQLNYLLNEIKWSTDYFIKCHPKPNEFYYQVGDGHLDHSWWGPAEVMQMERPAYKIDNSNPGSTVAGQTSAALAIASIVFRDIDPDYADLCLKHSKELFTFADSTKSDAGYKAAEGFYNSWSGFYDELSWAATWLYIATEDDTYLKKAESYVSKWKTEPQSSTIAYKWAQCWDDVHNGTALLLARITDKDVYKKAMLMHLDYWSQGYNGERISYSPGGLAFLDQWGSLRYATTTAFLGFVYSDWEGCDQNKAKIYQQFAQSQINYALGDNPRKGSYVVGFGENSPQSPHHRTSHGSWADSQNTPAQHRHILYGALVGGPNQNDQYNDSISDYVSNEVACDYNAGFVGALAKMYLLYGGDVDPNFKVIETPKEEVFVEAAINASGNNFVEIKAVVNNQSGWPARVMDEAFFRYYVDLSEVLKGEVSASDIKTSMNYNEGAKISELKHLKDNIYYVIVDLAGTKIYPGGQSSYKKEVQFRLSAPEGALWNSDNDFSYEGLSTGTPVKTQSIPLYEKGKLIYGNEPSPGSGSKPPVSEEKPTLSKDKPTKKPVEKQVDSPKEDISKLPTNNNQPSINSGDIKVQVFNTNTSATSNTLYPKFKIVNTGNQAIDLSTVTLRYYFTKDNEKELKFWCDWSPVEASNITGEFVTMNTIKNGADTYLEIGFTTNVGNLDAGSELEIQTRITKSDWSNFEQSEDYSFNASSSHYVDWDKVTVYVSRELKWGREP